MHPAILAEGGKIIELEGSATSAWGQFDDFRTLTLCEAENKVAFEGKLRGKAF